MIYIVLDSWRKLTESRIKIRRPEIQTYGAAIDKLLEIAFGVAPPVAKLSANAINRLINVIIILIIDIVRLLVKDSKI